MKSFMLVFEDLFRMDMPPDNINKLQTCIATSDSKEELIAHLGLVRIINSKRGSRELYWDGKINDVIISIYEISEQEILSHDDLNKTVRNLHCRWY